MTHHHHHGRLHRHLSAAVRSRTTTVTLVARNDDRSDATNLQAVEGQRAGAVTRDDSQQNIHRRDDVPTLTATDVVTMFKVAVESGKSLVTEYTLPTLPATVSDPLYGLITVPAQTETAVPNPRRPPEDESATEQNTVQPLQPPSDVRTMIDPPEPTSASEPDTETISLVSQPDQAPTGIRTPSDESSSSTTSATSAKSNSSTVSATSPGSSSSTTSETPSESDSSTTSTKLATSISTTQLTSTSISFPSSTRPHTAAETGYTTASTNGNSATSIGGDADSTPGGGVDVGKVVGGVVGGVAGLSLVLILIFLFIRWRRKRAVDHAIEPAARSAEMASHRASDTPLIPAFMRRLGLSSTRDAAAPAPAERGFQKISGRKIPPALRTGGDGYGDGVEDEVIPELKGQNLDAAAASPVSPRSPAGFARTGNGNGGRTGSDAGSSHDDDYVEESRDVVDLPPAPPAPSSLSPSSSFARPDALGRSLSRHDGSRSSRFTESI